MSTQPSERRSATAARRPWNRPWIAGAVVLLAYAGMSLLMSTGGSLGADTGAKVATLEVMHDRGSWRPEVGYWAEPWDPDGSVHGLQQSRKVGRDFIVVTTYPMLLAGHPLYDLGGYRLALLLPMLGGLGAAFGCRALARRLSDDDDAPWVAFWVTALASPLVLYSLDFWEHAPGAALMVWGAVHALDAARRRGAWWTPLAAGALFGAAATMRTEGLVAGFVAIGAACLVVAVTSRSVARVARLGMLAGTGFAGPWLVNALLEHVVLGSARGSAPGLDRTSRAEGLVRGAGFRTGDRLHEGLLSLFATYASLDWLAVLSGVLLVGLLAAGVQRITRGDRLAGAALSVAAASLVAIPMLDGLGWVPGGWVAFPVAGLGLLALGTPGALRWTAVACLVAYPVTWAVQYLDAALPQWGGRYALAITLVFGTCGLCAVAQRGRAALVVAVVPCVVVSALGIGWMAYRTHEINRLFDDLVDRPEDVVFAKYGVFLREGMAAYDERRWLAAGFGADGDDAVDEAAAVVEAAGLRTLGVLDETPAGARRIDDFELTGETRYETAGVFLYLHSYALADEGDRT